MSASAPPLVREIARSQTRSEPQIAASGAQCAHNDDEQLNRARAAIFKQQHELHEKLEVIDREMRAIDAYDAVKKRKTSRSRYERKR